jgi:hypothetical protein
MSLSPNNNRKMFDAIGHVMPLLTSSEDEQFAQWTASVPLDDDFIALNYAYRVRTYEPSQPVQFTAQTDGQELEVRFGSIYADEAAAKPIKPGIRQEVVLNPAKSEVRYDELVQPGHLEGLVIHAARASGMVVVQGLVEGRETFEAGLTGNITAAQFLLNACQWALTKNHQGKFRVPYMEEILPYRF